VYKGAYSMQTVAKLKDLTVEEFKTLISDTMRESMEDLLEDLAALSSKEYLTSIREAREDYKRGRVKSLEEIDV
jgi:lipoate-protein ligase A